MQKQGDRRLVDRIAFGAWHFSNLLTSPPKKKLVSVDTKRKGLDLRSIVLRSPRGIFSIWGPTEITKCWRRSGLDPPPRACEPSEL
jgi:hypothetical protein